MPYKNGRRKKTRTQKPEGEVKEKVPQSIVARKGATGPYVASLVKNIRLIMSPHTAIHLTERKSNSIRDFVNIAGPYGVTHIILLNKGKSYPHMRIGCFPQGPTLHFKINEYTLVHDILKLHKKGVDTTSPFFHPPVLILNNFPSNDKPMELVTKTFQNMFPLIDPQTVNIDECKRALLLQYDSTTKSILLRHYSIVRSIPGISKAVDSIVNKRRIPNLSQLNDISELITHADAVEDFEFDDDSVMSGASLSSTASTANGSPRQAVRLVELGPRMRITLMAVENGLFQGEFLFNLFSKEEKRELDQQRHQEKKIQEMEKKSVQKAEERDAKLEKEYKNMLNEVSRLRDKKKKEKMRKKERLLNNQTQKSDKGRERRKEKERDKGKGKVFHKKA